MPAGLPLFCWVFYEHGDGRLSIYQAFRLLALPILALRHCDALVPPSSSREMWWRGEAGTM